MAGGPHASEVPCLRCRLEGRWTRAVRTSEGIETDLYLCELGHTVGIDWSHDGPPERPLWPPPEGVDPRDT